MRAIAGMARSYRQTPHQCGAPNAMMHRNRAHT